MQMFKKNRRYSVAAVPNFDGLMWATQIQNQHSLVPDKKNFV